jgi:hypothetical protein
MELRNLFRRAFPRVLYKYFPPERVDVLQNGRLRFTQPVVFNDPFECSPAFLDFAPEKMMDRVSRVEAARMGMPEEERQRIFDSVYGPAGSRRRGQQVVAMLMAALGRGVGILSLTERPDNLLMWAHYAKSHEGFVIGFKTADSFLSRPGAHPNAANHLRKVLYSKRRVKLKFLTSLGLVEMYFTKSLEWQYEREWRMFTVLAEEDTKGVLEMCAKSIAQSGAIVGLPPCPVRLFDFPASCVENVTIGCRATDHTCNAIASIIGAKYPHAETLKAKISATEFKLVCAR